MAFTYVPGTFDFWAARQSTHLVDMHETAFVPFNVHQAVGTAGLGSCSVVAIASERAVILAHIPPLPDLHSQRPDAGDANVRQMMKRVRRLYRDNRQFFDNAEGRVTCAIYAGEVALPDQVAIMQEQLRLLGFEPSTDYYQVPADANVGRGTVVIVAPPHHQGQVGVYVEDSLVSSPASSPSPPPSVPTTSGAAVAKSSWGRA
ncbi:hypothetical protein HYQ45_016257 [Verticillium longisporum]|uniref:Uncharacterized protein n=1 Tax=Verticillium longisporum TaxID=100787 RepID=A0A8I2Z8N9_VERLO|nr:hypothetical protein HYQ45_016257 [Verticillium longisporum]